MNQNQHIEKVIEKQSCQQIENNCLRLKVSCDAIKWLTFQTCALRGHDESSNSKNRGNFIELIKILSSYNDKVELVVLENAPQNASYISPKVKKETLHVISNKVRDAIRDEIGDGKFCIIIDEAHDESRKEQMAIVLRFIDKDGYKISDVLARHNLSIKNIRGQGYDGASNMRGEWSGLQALFLSECPYAYYIHCFPHRLHLALVVESKEVISGHQFFSKLTLITNVVTFSSKRHDQLQANQIVEVEKLIANHEPESGKVNKVGTIKWAGDTQWSSHLSFVRSLVIMFEATYLVLKIIITEGATYSQRGDVDYAYNVITSFEFVFILHLMKEILEITDDLCQALQRKSQDILNAMGENGDLRVGVRRLMRQQINMPSSVISSQSMHLGVLAMASHAIATGTLFCVFYKRRTSCSEFIVSVNKYLEAWRPKLSVGMRFKMSFEGEEVPERRVSPWEIEPFVATAPSKPQPVQRKSPDLSALGKWKPPTESPALSYGDSQCGRDLYPSHNFSTTAKANSLGFSGNSPHSSVSPNSMYWPNRVESVTDSFVPVIKKDYGERRQSTGNGYRLFRIQLVDNSNAEETSSLAIESGMGSDCPVVSLDAESDRHSEPSNVNWSEIPSVSCEPEKSSLRSPQELQSWQSSSCTKVHMQGELDGSAKKWQVFYTDDEDDMMMVGDDPWHEFSSMVRKIFIYTSEEVKRLSPKIKLPVMKRLKQPQLILTLMQQLTRRASYQLSGLVDNNPCYFTKSVC
ncbi:hypothetical protein GH714_007261 [Hevea brasiliensis]|uniref:Auxin-responsive protein n=1 Tax=Hevea brasiliensis TaxID=3981 RepID=A0A6A6KYE4_HEVBR|nr:hypothetical protein GH714_007261 [Hevea brasiliensis]